MRVLPFVFTLLICQSHGFVDLQEQTEEVKDVALSVLHPDTSSIDVFTRRPYGLFQTIHRAKNGYRISSVTHAHVTLWDGTDGYSCDNVTSISYGHIDTHVSVHLKDGDGERISLYYSRDVLGWSPISKSKFYSSFHKMVKSKEAVNDAVLDIDTYPDPAKFYVNKSKKFPFTVFAARSTYRITEVQFCVVVIWKASSQDESCIYASFYPRDVPKVGYLILQTADGVREVYFRETEDWFCSPWHEIKREEYLERLADAGFYRLTFTNEVPLDLSNVDEDVFHKHAYAVGDYSEGLLTPLPGYLLTEVYNGSTRIWKAEDGEYCTYVDVYGKEDRPITLYLLVKDKEGGRKIIYYKKDASGSWSTIDKSLYFGLLRGRDDPTYTHQVDKPNIIMSSFRNKQGLKIATYASTVDKSRGDIILVHGICGSFVADFCTLNQDWINKHYDFPPFPYANPFGGYTPPLESDPADIYSHIFENASLEGKDALTLFPEYQYDGGLTKCLNKMGYNVYGMDMQSHGLSEDFHTFGHRCYVDEFKDYVNDLLQFISIVKRERFSDASQVYREHNIYVNMHMDNKLFLMGYSMGANIAMQAIQQFYRGHGDLRATVVDGFIGLSPMLGVKFYEDTLEKKLLRKTLWPLVWFFIEDPNDGEHSFDYGESFSFFMRYKDPFLYTNQLTLKAIEQLFTACDNVENEENMAHYPKNLPTLLVHTKDDERCSVHGPRGMMDKYFKESEDAKYVELDGSLHHLSSSTSFKTTIPHLKEWLDKYTAV